MCVKSHSGTLIRQFNGTYPGGNFARFQLLQLDDLAENDDDNSEDFIPHFDKPPKQKDKTRSKPKLESDHEYSSPITSDNPYSAYQYEFPYQYPFNFFPVEKPSSDSDTDSTKKTKKKSSGSSNSAKKPTKEPDKTIVPFISISVGQHQLKSDNDGSTTQNDSNAETAKSTLSPVDQKPPPNQAAYFNYLNTYTPNHNQYENQASPNGENTENAQIQSANKYNQVNPFRNRYPIHYGFGIPASVANSYGYPQVNPYDQHVGMPFFNIAPISSTGNLEHFEHNAKSEYSKRSI